MKQNDHRPLTQRARIFIADLYDNSVCHSMALMPMVVFDLDGHDETIAKILVAAVLLRPEQYN